MCAGVFQITGLHDVFMNAAESSAMAEHASRDTRGKARQILHRLGPIWQPQTNSQSWVEFQTARTL